MTGTLPHGPRDYYGMQYAIRYGSRECDMRCKYVMGHANAICDMRIRYGPRECDIIIIIIEL